MRFYMKEVAMAEEIYEELEEKTETEQLIEAANLENSYWEKKGVGDVDSINTPGDEKEPINKPITDKRRETEKAVKGGPGDHSWGGYEDKKKGYGPVKPDNISQEQWDNRPKWSRPLEHFIHAGSLPALGVADFASDAIGLVPWLKPIDEWWDKNSPRYNHPAYKLTRDAASVIIPSMYGGHAIVGKTRLATKSMGLSNFTKTLGSVAAYTGVDTSVAMISSHSQTDDNMAATLNNWLGWNIPWATRAADSPDVRWKKNVFENTAFAAGAELLGVAFSFSGKTRLIPRDSAGATAINKRRKSYTRGDNPTTTEIESIRNARKAAQADEMKDAIKADPLGEKGYNAFIHDIGPDDAGRAVNNIEPDPLLAKVNHAQIQNNIDTINGRAASVTGEQFNKRFLKAINGNARAKQLDELFDSISPQVDAVINGRKITSEQMNRSVDNLTNAVFGRDLDLTEFEFIVDDMKTTIFNSNEILDEDNWLVASQAFKNAYEKVFDPNQMRASAMLTQQAADTIADTATGIKMMGDNLDSSRQMKMIFDKLDLLAQEVKVNQFIVRKAQEYKTIKQSGDIDTVLRWMDKQGNNFEDYIREVKTKGSKINSELKFIAETNPEYYKPFVEAYDATNGNVDTLFKLQRLTEENIGLFKKGFVNINPKVPSQLVKQLHAARINSVLLGMAPIRAAVGNGMLTALKPISVFTGAYLQGKPAAFKRAMYTYGGIIENFKRGLKVMSDEWRLANMNPEEAMMRGRADLRNSQMEQLEYMDSMAEAWKLGKNKGDKAKYALWQMTKWVSWWNKQGVVRAGTNALYAIDGMTNSFMASGMARARAYDEVLHMNRGSIDFDTLFRDKQRQLYSQAFDDSGLLTDEAAKKASKEIALNEHNEVVKRFDDFLDAIPAARGIFMFPRTGVNAAALSWTFNPLSALGVSIPKVNRVMRAKTNRDMLESLAEHGIKEPKDLTAAFNALKSEYVGRQIMGSAVVGAAALWALEGNMTGNGPQDGAERQRMTAMGWQPLSLKDPITGKWRSYQGFEPFQQTLGLVADIVYQANRVDQPITEDRFRKVAFAITMNVTNNTFVGGFEPLASMLTADPTAWNRFWAQQIDQTLPAKGIRSILNNAISPQLRDVNNDILAYLQNANKFAFGGAEEDALPNLLDVYTGKPIRGYESITQAANAILPFFKQNSDIEPWRQWLLSTGWDGLQRHRKNKITGQPLTARERHYINNWVAKNAGLSMQIQKMMTENDGYWVKKMEEYRRGGRKMPIKEWVVHRELDRIHDQAFDNAWFSLQNHNAQFTSQGRELKMQNHYLNKGDLNSATETQKRILKLQKLAK